MKTLKDYEFEYEQAVKQANENGESIGSKGDWITNKWEDDNECKPWKADFDWQDYLNPLKERDRELYEFVMNWIDWNEGKADDSGDEGTYEQIHQFDKDYE